MKHFVLVLTLLVSIFSTQAQVPASQSTLSATIGDLLTKMPAPNNKELAACMENMASLGEAGLIEMTLMLAAPGTGDNTRLEYALGNYSYYTTTKGKEAQRTVAVHAYCKALDKKADKENKAFIIRQLEITGTEEAIDALKVYLSDERLADPAARALVKIQKGNAGKVLLEALKNVYGAQRVVDDLFKK